MEGSVPEPAEVRPMRVQLIRVHEDGTCARWRTNPNDLRLVLVIPAKTRRPPPLRGLAAA